jgi:hypothetical protein
MRTIRRRLAKVIDYRFGIPTLVLIVGLALDEAADVTQGFESMIRSRKRFP